jgi:hypothetical protein
VQYGGRVTDDFDKRLLCTITSVWFTEQLLRPGFSFHDGKNRFVLKFLAGISRLGVLVKALSDVVALHFALPN